MLSIMNVFMQESTLNETEICSNQSRKLFSVGTLYVPGLCEQFIAFKSVTCRPKTSCREKAKREVEPVRYDQVIHFKNKVQIPYWSEIVICFPQNFTNRMFL